MCTLAQSGRTAAAQDAKRHLPRGLSAPCAFSPSSAGGMLQARTLVALLPESLVARRAAAVDNVLDDGRVGVLEAYPQCCLDLSKLFGTGNRGIECRRRRGRHNGRHVQLQSPRQGKWSSATYRLLDNQPYVVLEPSPLSVRGQRAAAQCQLGTSRLGWLLHPFKVSFAHWGSSVLGEGVAGARGADNGCYAEASSLCGPSRGRAATR